MGSPLGAGEASTGALNDDERAALAAWVDDDEPSDAFTDKVLGAWLAEQAGEGSTEEGPVGEPERIEPEPRAAATGGRRVVGWMAALCTAAVVMLMVRVLPRASEVERGEERAESRPVASEPEHVVLGEHAAEVLADHCSPCHDSTDPGAKAEALEVFDLEQAYWWPTMSDAQLEDASMRVQELGEASEDERGRVATFVQAELRRRARAG